MDLLAALIGCLTVLAVVALAYYAGYEKGNARAKIARWEVLHARARAQSATRQADRANAAYRQARAQLEQHGLRPARPRAQHRQEEE